MGNRSLMQFLFICLCIVFLSAYIVDVIKDKFNR